MTTPTQQPPAALRARLTDGSLAGTWTLNPAQSTAALRSKSMWGLASVRGDFRDLEGSGTVSAAGEITGGIALPTGSLDTKNSKRDTHLRSADFFLSEKYPVITFSVGTIVPAGEGVTVSGTLTVRDSSRPISFPATVALTGDNEVVLDATVQVDRSEFGLTWNKMGMVSMNNAVTIHAVLNRS
jgi:polyisoprenoid-binding protein YceI